MYQIALTNPFSLYPTKIIKKFIDFEDFIKKMPDDAFNIAREKLEEDPIGKSLEIDIYSFYILFVSASQFGTHSIEGRAIIRRVEEIIEKRIKNIHENDDFYKNELHPNLLMEISGIISPVPLEDFMMKYRISEKDLTVLDSIVDPKYPNKMMRKKAFALKWNEILPAIKHKGISLTSLYIVNQHAILSTADLLDFYIGAIIQKAHGLIDKLSQAEVKISDSRLDEIGEKIKIYSEKTIKINYSHLKIQKNLDEKSFPPCVLSVLNGVSSGSRNYGISVFLTSFLSYARIAPIGASKNSKISDYIKDEKIIIDEIIPIIDSAAKKCSPPLFEDQPLERLNVFYHLGFGLTENLKIGDSGKSSWYFVPNCDKIRREGPTFCRPDKDCKVIKNPLSYYVKKSGIYKEVKKKKVKS